MSDEPRNSSTGMWSWTDWREPSSIVAAGSLSTIVADLVTGDSRVLFAGPHDEGMVTAAQAAGAVVTWLVRSVEDAARLTHDLPGVKVLCGSLGATGERFDLVVALDGFGRLTSAEDDDVQRDLVAELAASVGEDGVLVLLHENPLGVHRTIELAPGREYTADAAWYLPEAHEPRLPASMPALTGALGGQGLHVHAGYAAFPTPKRPHVLVGRPVLDDPRSPVRRPLRPLLAQAFTEAYQSQPVLDDPRDLVGRMAYAAAEETLAAGWLVIASRGQNRTFGQHALVVSTEGGTQVTLLSTIDGEELRGVPRTVGGLQEVTPLRLPSGPVFEEQLLRSCAAADIPAVRAQLRRYAAWLATCAKDGELTGPAALATFGTVCDDGDELQPDLVRWEPVEPVPVTVALHRALWDFASTLITRNRPHPYPVTFDAAQLAAVLGAAVDAVPGPRDIDAVVELEIAARAAEENLDPVATRQALTADLRPVPDVAGYREFADVLWRQNYLLQHARETAAWMEKILLSRDTMLSKLDLQIQDHQRTAPEQVVELARKAYKKIRTKAAAQRRGAETTAKPKLCSACQVEQAGAGTHYRRLRLRVERIDFEPEPPQAETTTPRQATAPAGEKKTSV